MWVIIILIIVVLFIIFKLKFKKLKLDNLTLFTGGLKVGKTCFSVYKAKKNYDYNLKVWRIKKFISEKIFHKKYKVEMPLFYSNIPVAFDYVPLTWEHITRQKRIRFKSITFIDETSLLADSMSAFKQDGKSKSEIEEFNSVLLVFIKLYCHETHNGSLYLNTQSLSDLHFSFRRCMSRYIYLHSCIKWLPFFLVYRVSEMYYSEDNNNVNVNVNGDILENTKWCFVKKSIWKKYDRFCYDEFTNNLECNDNIIHGAYLPDLKANYVLTSRKLPSINNEPLPHKPYVYKKKKVSFFGIFNNRSKKKITKKGVKKNDKKEIQ